MKLKILAAVSLLAFGLVLTATSPWAVNAAEKEIQVYKSPTCGCCTKWVDHLKQNGFKVTTHDMQDMSQIKTERGVPPMLASCHTAVVDGYVLEGHVPASTLKKLLSERPKVKGIAVPGMPIGSPGMEGPNPRPYDVISFDDKGKTAVFENIKPQ